MRSTATEHELFAALKVCVLVPTYNNAATLPALLEGISRFTSAVLVVNDGSTDGTAAVLEGYPAMQIITYQPNHGKGYALRAGFRAAGAAGYDYAITIDSDGQHYPEDLPLFLNALAADPGCLLIGARNLSQENVPAKSSFGNRFSSFWFRVETGIRLPDTQSGYRLYPLWRLEGMRFLTRKYEFEIEVIVRAAWRGIPVRSIPVSVYYPPPEQRVSHFRPFRDVARISLLNTVLTLTAVFYIKPRDLVRRIFGNKSWRNNLREELFRSGESDLRKSVSVGFGLFMGIVPLWGFQLLVAIFLSVLLRLNKVLVIIFANISIPPMLPLIIFASYQAGALLMPGHSLRMAFSKALSLQAIRYNFTQYLAGSLLLSVATGLVGAALAYLLLKIFSRQKSILR